MAGTTLLERFVQLAQQLALVLGELDRRLDRDVAVQVARVAGAHALDALAAQAELLAGLGAFGNVDRRLARESGHFDLAAEGGRDEAYGHLAMQIITVALEDVVLLQANLDIQVTGWSTVGAGLSVAGAADAHAVVDAGRNLHFQRFLLLELALAVAGGAGLRNDLAGAAAVRARLLHAEEALAHLHRAAAAAGGAGLGAGAWLGTAAVAGVATLPGWNTDLCILAACSLFEGDFHGIAQVAAAIHLSSARPAPAALLAEHVAKDVAESLGKATKPLCTRPAGAAHVGVHAGVAVLIVGRAFLGVRQHLVGLFGLLELFFGALGCITLVAIGVVLHRELAIGLLDFFFRGVLGNAQDFVIVSFGHGRSEPGWNRNAAQAPSRAPRGGWGQREGA